MSRKFRTKESETPCEDCKYYDSMDDPFEVAMLQLSEKEPEPRCCIFTKHEECHCCKWHYQITEFEEETTKPCKDFRRKDG